MIKCKECGKDISDAAAACPQCGCPVVKAPEAAAPAAPAVSRRKKIMSAIGSVLGVLGVIAMILFNVFKDDLNKMVKDERVISSLNGLCEKTFKHAPFKIVSEENNIYKVIWVDPAGDKVWMYTSPTVKSKLVKGEDGKDELDFATDKDRESWQNGVEIFNALNALN